MPTAAEAAPTSIGVDVGGTFTDLVAFIDGKIVTSKVRSSRSDQSAAVISAIGASGVPAARVDMFAHGTTVATNALLERRGARTAMVTTRGFRDVIEIGRQNRPRLYDLTAAAPPPLVTRELRFTVNERVGPRGVERPLDARELDDLIAQLRDAQVESIAVCLLFSFAVPAHEELIRLALSNALPHAYVACSSEVLPEFREFERFSTTAANGYLGPVLASYLGRLDERLRSLGIARAHVMLSSGGTIDLRDAPSHASQCVLSGPAAGVVAAAWVAGESGQHDLLTFDMGGTSTDVALVLDGEVQVTTDSQVGGVPIGHPMVDIHTVSSGGGSIAWLDDAAALRVGPVSAGGEPGPACYGLGGAEPTVTDAHLVLGYLRDGVRLGDGVTLRRDLAARAIGSLSEALGLDLTQTAAGIVSVAEAEMIRALRVVSVERGVHPRSLTLVAFGGAGGVHACSLAEGLEVETVLVPRSAGVLSALGLAISDLRRDYTAACLARLDDLTDGTLETAFSALERRADDDLPRPTHQRFADVRYAGQAFELTVPADSPHELGARFMAAHQRRYGYVLDGTPLETVALRVRSTVPMARPSLAMPPTTHADSQLAVRPAHFDGVWLDTAVIDGAALASGERLNGPAIVEYPVATCVIRPGWAGAVDAGGALILRQRAAGAEDGDR